MVSAKGNKSRIIRPNLMVITYAAEFSVYFTSQPYFSGPSSGLRPSSCTVLHERMMIFAAQRSS